jgi:(p)ppGpp synthase/HD superfamily hydrolase
MYTRKTAELFARAAHLGQGYNGRPYFDYHIMNVVNRVKADPTATEEHVIVAYLHDSMEDSKAVTMQALIKIFGLRIAVAVKAISRSESETYFDYIRMVRENALARKVKFHDLMENLSHCGDTSLGKRYEKALVMLASPGESENNT